MRLHSFAIPTRPNRSLALSSTNVCLTIVCIDVHIDSFSDSYPRCVLHSSRVIDFESGTVKRVELADLIMVMRRRLMRLSLCCCEPGFRVSAEVDTLYDFILRSKLVRT